MKYILRAYLGFQKICARALYRDDPMTMNELWRLHRVAKKYLSVSDSLLISRKISDGKQLKNNVLSTILNGITLGEWSITADTINFLEEKIKKIKPVSVLEFGSGVSTICLAVFMKELYPLSSYPLVFSIDQDVLHMQQTRNMLEENGLGRYVKTMQVPLRQQNIPGVGEHACYDFRNVDLYSFFKGKKPDFVLVDGPAGEDGCRSGTLPLVKSYLSDTAIFYLDDALRDGEIMISKQWAECPFIKVKGIHWIGSGLLVGSMCR